SVRPTRGGGVGGGSRSGRLVHRGRRSSSPHAGRAGPSPAAFLVLSAAAAWALVVSPRHPGGRALVAEPGPLHHVGRRARVPKLGCHELHVRVDVAKERLVARAQVIQSFFAIRGTREAMLRTLAVAGEAHVALAAVSRQRSVFGLTEVALLR